MHQVQNSAVAEEPSFHEVFVDPLDMLKAPVRTKTLKQKESSHNKWFFCETGTLSFKLYEVQKDFI